MEDEEENDLALYAILRAKYIALISVLFCDTYYHLAPEGPCDTYYCLALEGRNKNLTNKRACPMTDLHTHRTKKRYTISSIWIYKLLNSMWRPWFNVPCGVRLTDQSHDAIICYLADCIWQQWPVDARTNAYFCRTQHGLFSTQKRGMNINSWNIQPRVGEKSIALETALVGGSGGRGWNCLYIEACWWKKQTLVKMKANAESVCRKRMMPQK